MKNHFNERIIDSIPGVKEKFNCSENMGKEKSKKRQSSSTDDSTSSSSSESSREKKKLRKLKKKLKKEQKKTEKLLKKKLKEEKRKLKKKRNSESQDAQKDEAPADIPIELMEKSKAMAPMTKEEWEQRQSVVRKVMDEETGRYRLIKGDGEVLEEIVSRDRHKQINKQATNADGTYFQAQTLDKKKLL